MKTMRHLILSVLLSAFGFFIVHDYALADVDADTQLELCKYEGESALLDLPSQIHQHIHILLTLPETHLFFAAATPLQSPDIATPRTPLSYISSIRPRPPLS